MRPRPTEHDHIFVSIAAGVFVANIVYQPRQLALIIRCLSQRNSDIGVGRVRWLIFTGLLLWLQPLTAKRLGQRHQIGPRAIVTAEWQDFCAGKILRELADIGGRSATEAIDSLVSISHHPDPLLLTSQFAQQDSTGAIDILELVNEDMLIFLLLFS